MIYQGQLDKDRLAEALRILPPVVPRKASTRSKKPSASPERVHALIWARYDALTHLDEIGDNMLYAARNFYSYTYPFYVRHAYGELSLITSDNVVEESLNKACIDLATALGLIRSGLVAPQRRQAPDLTTASRKSGPRRPKKG